MASYFNVSFMDIGDNVWTSWKKKYWHEFDIESVYFYNPSRFSENLEIWNFIVKTFYSVVFNVNVEIK